ncbi:uncharacterized protein C8R40DRAFT_1133492 [Lentinula edodes]|uniref:uncharacterized protein n=1 Tax=Lentinula edodes TaxID=5353 RepID=UPI001E8E383A|nr:uncharacterized protein C8R40DRAFT_1133492 [Lentinula edodes]KAH7868823.1 hypothetical protein C8R40DRAFT_1133492 [Lentinula edodes]
MARTLPQKLELLFFLYAGGYPALIQKVLVLEHSSKHKHGIAAVPDFDEDKERLIAKVANSNPGFDSIYREMKETKTLRGSPGEIWDSSCRAQFFSSRSLRGSRSRLDFYSRVS